MGFIYVLHNEFHASRLYKVGMTTRNDLEARVKEISGATGVPTPFKVVYKKKVKARKALPIEQQIHKRLKKFRVNDRREFFHCSLWRIKWAIWRCA